MSRPFRIDWEAASDVGRVRQVNEDSVAAFPDRGLWAVADGMGGHAGGDWASATLAAAIGQMPRTDDLDEAVQHCAAAIHTANATIWQEAASRGASMGTTVVALLMIGRRFAVLWAGDSRAYLLRGGALVQVTRDHSQVQAMVDRGLLTPEDAADHPMGHVLSRAVGVQEALEVDVVLDEIAPDDLFLLTSDGVHGVLPPDEITRVIGANAIADVPDALVTRGMEFGSTDNLTAIAIGVTETTQLMIGVPAGVSV